MLVQEVFERLLNFAYLARNLINYAGVETIENRKISTKILRRFYTIDGDLKRNNWKSINLLKEYGMTTFDKLVAEFKFVNKYRKYFVYKKDDYYYIGVGTDVFFLTI